MTDNIFEVAQLAFGAPHLEPIAVTSNRDAGGIVSAILELAQALDNHGHNALLTYISNNAAHIKLLPFPTKRGITAETYEKWDASCCSEAYLEI
jgi:hypothetical protein